MSTYTATMQSTTTSSSNYILGKKQTLSVFDHLMFVASKHNVSVHKTFSIKHLFTVSFHYKVSANHSDLSAFKEELYAHLPSSN